MTRRVVIAADCDDCRAPATAAFVIGVSAGDTNRPALHVVDACADHAGQWAALAERVKSLAPFHREAAAKPEAPPAEVATCDICGSEVGRGSLVGHVWGHAPGERTTSTTCPECGQVFPTTRAAGAHRSRVHGYNALTAAYAAARAPAKAPRQRRVVA